MSFPFPMISPRTSAPAVIYPVTLDFVTGTYIVNGVTKSASDVIDQPSWVDGTGLVIADSAATVAILGDALTYLLTANWTLVVKWDNFTSTNDIFPFVMADGSNDNAVQLRRQSSLSSNLLNVQDFAGINFRQATDLTPVGDGVHTSAVTRISTELGMSVDGRTVVSDTSITFSLAPVAAALGGYPSDTIGDPVTIKYLYAMTPQDDSLLPGLSA